MREWRQRNRELVREKNKERWTGERRETANARRAARYQREKDAELAARKRGYRKARSDLPWQLLLDSAKGRVTGLKRDGSARAFTRLKTKEVPFTIDNAWAASAWTGRCALTGITFKLDGSKASRMFSPSIDRIDPSLGYVPENCRFVLWAVNALKGTGTDEEMLLIARALVVAADKGK